MVARWLPAFGIATGPKHPLRTLGRTQWNIRWGEIFSLSKKARAHYRIPSADRNNKATLLRTGLRATTKSYAKASTPGAVKLQGAS